MHNDPELSWKYLGTISADFVKVSDTLKEASYQIRKAGFDYPTGIAVDNLGFIYVSDSKNNRVQKFTNNGQYITEWGTKGTENGQFDFPAGIDIDSEGNIYVVDRSNARIQKFSEVKN